MFWMNPMHYGARPMRNGNPRGDLSKVRRCGAQARTRGGQPCRGPALKGKARCRMHGGRSRGPRTPDGLARSRRAHWLHGRHSREALEARRIANWETVELAKARIERKSRRESRRQTREARQMSRALDQLLARRY
jgi:hypothetical protein